MSLIWAGLIVLLFPGKVSFGKEGVVWEFWWLPKLEKYWEQRKSPGGNVKTEEKKEEVFSSMRLVNENGDRVNVSSGEETK